jgi:hypothetical protein
VGLDLLDGIKRDTNNNHQARTAEAEGNTKII